MNTSFFFGWKAAILSAISSRAVNLPRKEITKLGVMNEEQKMDDKRTTKSPSHWICHLLFLLYVLTPILLWMIQSQLFLFNKGSKYLGWRGLAELWVFKSIQNTSLPRSRFRVPGGRVHSQGRRLLSGCNLRQKLFIRFLKGNFCFYDVDIYFFVETKIEMLNK